jgi:hypothetical protein
LRGEAGELAGPAALRGEAGEGPGRGGSSDFIPKKALTD